MKFKRSVISALANNVTDGEHASVLDDIDGNYFLLSNKNIKDGKVIYDKSDRKINFETFKSINRRTKLCAGDVVISTVGSIGRTAIIKDYPLNFDFQRSVGIIKPNINKLTPEYLHYYFQVPAVQRRLINLSKGAVQKCLFISDLNEIEIDHPEEVDDQEKLVSILSIIDHKIELNNKINSELESMSKTLYDYWFVQFDFPDTNGKPYKTSGGKMVWNEELKREIPEGWEVQKMSEWINIDKSGDWGKDEEEGNFTKKVICFRGADINGLNGLDELKPPVRFILEKNSFKILKSHDLIIEISGGSPTQSTGRLAFITDATMKRFEYPLICSNFCKPVSIRNKKLLYNFVYYWNSLYNNGVFFGYEGKTSGIKNLLLDSFISSYYTVVPEEKIVEKFYNIMESIQEKKQTALAENQKLTELRDWLLPMLMNGQVKIK